MPTEAFSSEVDAGRVKKTRSKRIRNFGSDSSEAKFWRSAGLRSVWRFVAFA
jgi:hypothetical protein